MRACWFALLSTVMLSACVTTPIDTTNAPNIPESRIYVQELLTPDTNRVELLVARDAGTLGSACAFAVYLDGQLVSAIRQGEKLTLYISPGRHVLGAGPNPRGV